MAIVFVSGSVDLSIDVAARFGLDVSALTPEAVARIEAIVDDLAFRLGEFIDSVWPVDTGASQASWESTQEGFFWVIRNDREYAEYVHRAGDSTEVWRIVEARSEELLQGAAARISRAAATGLRQVSPPSQPLQGLAGEVISSLVRASLVGSVVSETGLAESRLLSTGLFAARARAFQRVSTRIRERARSRAR